METLDTVASELITRPFSLHDVEAVMRAEADELDEEAAQQEMYRKGDLLIFAQDPDQRACELMLRTDHTEDVAAEAARYRVRQKIAAALRKGHRKQLVTLQDLKFPTWKQRFAYLLPDDPQQRDTELLDHQGEIVLTAVCKAYAENAMRTGLRAKYFSLLAEAVQECTYDDPSHMIAMLLTNTILGRLLPRQEEKGQDDGHIVTAPQLYVSGDA